MTTAPAPVHGRHAPPRRRMLWWTAAALAAVALALLLLFRHDVFGGGSSTSGPVEGSGVLAVQTRSVPAFHGIDLAGSNVVTVRVGGARSVVVRADANLVGRVTTQVRGGTLVVADRGSYSTSAPTSVAVTVPSLDALTLSGSGTVVADGIDASRLAVTLSGSGIVRANGTAERLDVELGGSGDVQVAELVAGDVHARLTGSGRILVHAADALVATLSGSGTIVYGGDPARVETSVTGSGAIVRG